MSTGYRRWDGGWPPASTCGHQHRRIRIADHCSQLVRYFRLETAENHDNGVTCQWRRHVGPLGRSKTVPPGV